MVERNMSDAAMRGIAALPGSKTTSRAKGSRRNLGGPASGRVATPPGSASGRRGAIADDARTREVGLCHSSCEADEQGGAIRCGAGGAKGGDQGECGPAKHAPGAEPGKRVTGAGPHTASCKAKEEGDGSPRSSTTSASTCFGWRSSRSRRDAAAGRGRTDVAGLRGRPRAQLEDLHARVHRGAYRPQPSRRQYIPKPDGRQRPLAIAALEDKIVQRATVAVLNAIYEEDFLGFSYGFRPGAQPARCAGCAGGRDQQQEGELHFGRRHPELLRCGQPGLADPLRRASDRRPAHHPPDPEMAQGGHPRRRGRDGQ